MIIIILQVLAILAMVVLSPLVLLTYLFMLRFWIFDICIMIFYMLYSLLLGAATMNIYVSLIAFAVFVFFYYIKNLFYPNPGKGHIASTSVTTIVGNIFKKDKKLRIRFYVPLYPLYIVKSIPVKMMCKISKESTDKVDVKAIIKGFLQYGKGTNVSIKSKEADIYFEII